MPRPAGGRVKCPAACVAGQAARNAQQSAAERTGGANGRARQSKQLRPAQQVVRQRSEHDPCAVGVELPGREVRQGLVFEVGDHLLDDGVLAVLGFDHGDLLAAVGDEREVPPVGPQLSLGAEQTGAADDQPPTAVAGLGDLRLTLLGVGEVLPGVLVLTPVAPARSTRAISSSVNRSIPFCVFADPLRRRMCSASRVSARVARIG